MTYLCVAIFAESPAQIARDAARAAELGADLLEMRIDRLTEPMTLPDLSLPYVVTCRPEFEGGEGTLSDEQRIELIESTGGPSAAYVDIELATFRRFPGATQLAQFPGRTILSAHDFEGRPPRLHNVVLEMNQAPTAVNKIVWLARSIRDNLEAFELLRTRQKPTIALCMGEAGLISRVLAKKFGGFLSFASLEKESVTAPGQIPVAQMKRLYRWDAINPDTKVYGVVAQPVAHSMSPAIHNAAFEAMGHDGVYLPLLVNAGYESFKAFMESVLAFAPLDLSGLSITLPHKENALQYLQEKGAQIEELAVRIGAVNTIAIERSGDAIKLRGLNTDYLAILDSITAKLNVPREKLADYRVGVIGAGGTGRTAVAALAHCGATVVVYNRTRDRADRLVREFDGKTGRVIAAGLDKLRRSACQIFINTTAVGMHPHVDQSPFDDSLPPLTPQSLVFDAVYNPPRTKLLQQAQAAGAQTISGLEMFLRQAVAQFEAWTGLPAPVEVMRAVVEEKLGSARTQEYQGEGSR